MCLSAMFSAPPSGTSDRSKSTSALSSSFFDLADFFDAPAFLLLPAFPSSAPAASVALPEDLLGASSSASSSSCPLPFAFSLPPFPASLPLSLFLSLSLSATRLLRLLVTGPLSPASFPFSPPFSASLPPPPLPPSIALTAPAPCIAAFLFSASSFCFASSASMSLVSFSRFFEKLGGFAPSYIVLTPTKFKKHSLHIPCLKCVVRSDCTWKHPPILSSARASDCACSIASFSCFSSSSECSKNSCLFISPAGVVANSFNRFDSVNSPMCTTLTISRLVRGSPWRCVAMYSAAPHTPDGRRPVWIQSRFILATRRIAVELTECNFSSANPILSANRWI